MRAKKQDGIRNLCAVAVHLRQTMEVNAATKFAIRTVLREAINKSNENYKGNNNRKNCRYISIAATQQLLKEPNAALLSDHAIPVGRSLEEFEKMGERTIDGVVELVARYATMVLITLEEDERLRAANLVKTMPKDWQDGHELLARYMYVGIDVRPNPAPGNTAGEGSAELKR
jgi:hypothetical protein